MAFDSKVLRWRLRAHPGMKWVKNALLLATKDWHRLSAYFTSLSFLDIFSTECLEIDQDLARSGVAVCLILQWSRSYQYHTVTFDHSENRAQTEFCYCPFLHCCSSFTSFTITTKIRLRFFLQEEQVQPHTFFIFLPYHLKILRFQTSFALLR